MFLWSTTYDRTNVKTRIVVDEACAKWYPAEDQVHQSIDSEDAHPCRWLRTTASARSKKVVAREEESSFWNTLYCDKWMRRFSEALGRRTRRNNHFDTRFSKKDRNSLSLWLVERLLPDHTKGYTWHWHSANTVGIRTDVRDVYNRWRMSAVTRRWVWEVMIEGRVMGRVVGCERSNFLRIQGNWVNSSVLHLELDWDHFRSSKVSFDVEIRLI